MMQFLWRYVDQLVGKGLGVEVLLQFFFYSALTLIPVSLPLAVLLASLITFGNFGERFELLAMKAAGISLIKIMRPLIVLIAFLCLTSFFFQNIITPEAQTKLYTLIISMKQKSPELDIPEGVFYNEIKGYNLYVKEKDRKTGLLRHITIYNFSNGFENAQIVVADSGRLEMAEDKQHLFLRLYSGELFENLKAQNMSSENVPYRRESFQEKHSIIQFDADFNMVDESIMSGQSNSKNMQELELSIDSMRTVADSIGNVYFEEAISTSYQKLTGLSKNDSTAIQKANIKEFDVDSILKVSTLSKRQAVLNKALNKSETIGGDWEFKSYTASRNDENIRRHQIAWHEKFTLSLACLIFFFIGAPLGAIIRKGGLGMPVVISVLIFIVYYIINNTGYKMARDGNWIIWMGMWTSTAILAPIGFFLTYKSNNDSVVLNADLYIELVKRFFGIRAKRHLSIKEVVIETPNYNAIGEQLEEIEQHLIHYLKTVKLKKAPNYIKLWVGHQEDEEFNFIRTNLESCIEQLSNSKDFKVISFLNNYPILPARAHTRPFENRWLNLLFGVFLPIGLFYYFRVWIFRIRLEKDLNSIQKNNKEIRSIIDIKE